VIDSIPSSWSANRKLAETGLWEMTVQTKTVSQQGFTPRHENTKEWILESEQML
jgi:hypothetical protein